MIKVSVEVCDATASASTRVAVRAENIEHAMCLVRARYPNGEAKLLFPIEPEDFFIDEAAPATALVSPEAAMDALR